MYSDLFLWMMQKTVSRVQLHLFVNYDTKKEPFSFENHAKKILHL